MVGIRSIPGLKIETWGTQHCGVTVFSGGTPPKPQRRASVVAPKKSGKYSIGHSREYLEKQDAKEKKEQMSEEIQSDIETLKAEVKKLQEEMESLKERVTELDNDVKSL
jgi:peptidoglycan hydrolase CwlO-like protein